MQLLRYMANIPVSRYSLIYPFAYMALIYGLSSIPGTPPSPHEPHSLRWLSITFMNSLHIPLFAGLAWCWRWSLTAVVKNTWLIAILTFCLTVAYGMIDEWHQIFTPHRTSSLLDLLLDATGALLALWLFSRYSATREIHTQTKV